MPEGAPPPAADAAELRAREDEARALADELKTRADIAAGALEGIAAELQPWLKQESAPAALKDLRGLLLRSSRFGVAGAVPLSAAGDDEGARDVLTLQAQTVAKEVSRRLGQLSDVEVGAGPEAERASQVKRLQAAFGAGFTVLPRFRVWNAPELGRSLADSEKIQDGDPLAAVSWFRHAARIREGVARLDASLGYAEALGTGERLKLTLAQLPHREDDRWVGLPLLPDAPPSLSRFSLVVQSAGQPDLSRPLAGLLVDEWVETVPGVSETTGVVFQYDQPDAAPPQCILLAVPPVPDRPWDVQTLQQVLLETLDLACVRAIDPEALDEVRHFLPALYFAVNTAGETVSTDLTKLK